MDKMDKQCSCKLAPLKCHAECTKNEKSPPRKCRAVTSAHICAADNTTTIGICATENTTVGTCAAKNTPAIGICSAENTSTIGICSIENTSTTGISAAKNTPTTGICAAKNTPTTGICAAQNTSIIGDSKSVTEDQDLSALDKSSQYKSVDKICSCKLAPLKCHAQCTKNAQKSRSRISASLAESIPCIGDSKPNFSTDALPRLRSMFPAECKVIKVGELEPCNVTTSTVESPFLPPGCKVFKESEVVKAKFSLVEEPIRPVRSRCLFKMPSKPTNEDEEPCAAKITVVENRGRNRDVCKPDENSEPSTAVTSKVENRGSQAKQLQDLKSCTAIVTKIPRRTRAKDEPCTAVVDKVEQPKRAQFSNVLLTNGQESQECNAVVTKVTQPRRLGRKISENLRNQSRGHSLDKQQETCTAIVTKVEEPVRMGRPPSRDRPQSNQVPKKCNALASKLDVPKEVASKTESVSKVNSSIILQRGSSCEDTKVEDPLAPKRRKSCETIDNAVVTKLKRPVRLRRKTIPKPEVSTAVVTKIKDPRRFSRKMGKDNFRPCLCLVPSSHGQKANTPLEGSVDSKKSETQAEPKMSTQDKRPTYEEIMRKKFELFWNDYQKFMNSSNMDAILETKQQKRPGTPKAGLAPMGKRCDCLDFDLNKSTSQINFPEGSTTSSLYPDYNVMAKRSDGAVKYSSDTPDHQRVFSQASTFEPDPADIPPPIYDTPLQPPRPVYEQCDQEAQYNFANRTQRSQSHTGFTRTFDSTTADIDEISSQTTATTNYEPSVEYVECVPKVFTDYQDGDLLWNEPVPQMPTGMTSQGQYQVYPRQPSVYPTQPSVYPTQSSVYPTQPSVYPTQSSAYLPQRSVYPPQRPVCPPQSPNYHPQSPVYQPQSPVYQPQPPVYQPKPSVYQPQPSVYHLQSSAYPSQPAVGPPQGSVYHRQSSVYPSHYHVNAQQPQVCRQQPPVCPQQSPVSPQLSPIFPTRPSPRNSQYSLTNRPKSSTSLSGQRSQRRVPGSLSENSSRTKSCLKSSTPKSSQGKSPIKKRISFDFEALVINKIYTKNIQCINPQEIKKLVEKENQDIEIFTKYLDPSLNIPVSPGNFSAKKKMGLLKINNQDVALLYKSLVGPSPSADAAQSEPTPEMIASLMHVIENSIDPTDEPSKNFNALFKNPFGKDTINMSPVADGYFQDVIVPLNEPESIREQLVTGDLHDLSINFKKEVRDGFKGEGDCPTDNLFSSRKKLEDIDLEKLNKHAPPDADNCDICEAALHIGAEPLDMIDIVDVENTEDIQEDLKAGIQYYVSADLPQYMSRVQLRGSAHPPWFPGYIFATTSGEEAVKLVETPSEVFRNAWKAIHPNYFKRSDLILP